MRYVGWHYMWRYDTVLLSWGAVGIAIGAVRYRSRRPYHCSILYMAYYNLYNNSLGRESSDWDSYVGYHEDGAHSTIVRKPLRARVE